VLGIQCKRAIMRIALNERRFRNGNVFVSYAPAP
jgi:hypothetical protein